MNKRFALLVIGSAFCLSDVAVAQKDTSECAVTITSPKPGAMVAEDAQVEGRAVIPPGKFLWVFGRRKGLQLWWPQGGGPATITNGSWQAVVTFGTEKDVSREFEAATAVVDSNTNEQLQSWVKKAEETGRYPGIKFPSTIGGCRIADVTVTKTR